MYLEISLVVLSILFLLIAALLIPFLIQIWRTAKSITITLHMLNQSLPGILRNLEEITANINRATDTVNNHVEGLSRVVGRIQNTTENYLDLERELRTGLITPFFIKMRTLSAALKGIRVFLDVLRSSH
jgi:uncharacterized protein YoxC